MPQVSGPLDTTQPYIPLITKPEKLRGVHFSVDSDADLAALDTTILLPGQRVTVVETGTAHRWSGTAFEAAPSDVSAADAAKLSGITIPQGQDVFQVSFSPDLLAPLPLEGANIVDTVAYITLQNLEGYFQVDLYLDGAFKEAVHINGRWAYRIDTADFQDSAEHTVTMLAKRRDSNLLARQDATFTITNTPIPPRLIVSPDTIVITTEFGFDPPSRKIDISTSEGDAVTVHLASSQSWLTFSANDQVAPFSVSLIADTDLLAVGTYPVQLTLTATGFETLVTDLSVEVMVGAEYTLLKADSDIFAGAYLNEGSVWSGDVYIRPSPTPPASATVQYTIGALVKTRTAGTFDLGDLTIAPTDAAVSVAASNTLLIPNGTRTIQALISLPARENRVLYSRDITNSYWSKFQIIPVAAAEPSWDGSFTAQKWQAGSSAGQHESSQNTAITKTASEIQNWVAGVIAKAADYSWIRVRARPNKNDSTNSVSYNCDLTTGAVGAKSAVGTYDGGVGTSVALPNGYWLFKLPIITGPEATVSLNVKLASAEGVTSFTPADPGYGVIVADIQMVEGSTWKEYAVTTDTPIIETAHEVNISDTIYVLNTEQTFVLSETDLYFEATAGGANPAPQDVVLTPTTGTAEWTVVSDTAWASATLSGTATPGSPSTITVTAALGALPANTYLATLTVSAPGYPAKTLKVHFTVLEAAAEFEIYGSTDLAGLTNGFVLRNASISSASPVAIWLSPVGSPNTKITLRSTPADYARCWNDIDLLPQGEDSPPVSNKQPGSLLVFQSTNSPYAFPTTPGQHSLRARYYRPEVGHIRVNSTYTIGTAGQDHIDGAGFYIRAAGVGASTLNDKETILLNHPRIAGYEYLGKMKQWVPNDPGAAYNDPVALEPFIDYTGINSILNIVATGKQKNVLIQIRDMYNASCPAWMQARGWLIEGNQPDVMDPNFFLNWTNVQAVDFCIALYTAIYNHFANNDKVVGVFTAEKYISGAPITYTALRTQLIRFAQAVAPVYKRKHLIIGQNISLFDAASVNTLVSTGIGWSYPDIALPNDSQSIIIPTNTKASVVGHCIGDTGKYGGKQKTVAQAIQDEVYATDRPQVCFMGIGTQMNNPKPYVNGTSNFFSDTIAALDAQPAVFPNSALKPNLAYK